MEKSTGNAFGCSCVLCIPLFVLEIYKGQFISPDDFSFQNGQFSLRQIDIKAYLHILKGTGKTLQVETMHHFYDALLQTSLSNGWLPVTYASLPVVIILIFILIRLFSSHLLRNKAELINYIVTFICGTIGYAFMMSVMYMFCFTDGEMRDLAGFTRYMNSYALSEILICIFLFILLLAEKRNSLKKLLITALCALCLINPFNIRHIMPQAFTQNPYESYRQYALRLEETVPDDSVVFIIYDKEQTMHSQWYSPLQLFTQYYNDKVDIVEKYCGALEADYSKEKVKNNILESIKNSDYLHIVNSSDNVNSGLSELTGGMELKDNSIYIVNDNGMLEMYSDGSNP